jgi:hypothetical protein
MTPKSGRVGLRPVPLRAQPDGAMSALLTRVKGEYLEMPGLQLTLPQAARFWGLDSRTSEWVLEHLVDAGFLWRTGRGMYGRRTA